MTILSVTFHATNEAVKSWEHYIDNDLKLMIDNLFDVDKYIFSDVESDLISEGKNYNLFLIFERPDLREDFLKSELKNIEEHIVKKFGESVMIFITYLHPKFSRF